jgi:hypothetical protein
MAKQPTDLSDILEKSTNGSKAEKSCYFFHSFRSYKHQLLLQSSFFLYLNHSLLVNDAIRQQ